MGAATVRGSPRRLSHCSATVTTVIRAAHRPISGDLHQRAPGRCRDLTSSGRRTRGRAQAHAVIAGRPNAGPRPCSRRTPDTARLARPGRRGLGCDGDSVAHGDCLHRRAAGLPPRDGLPGALVLQYGQAPAVAPDALAWGMVLAGPGGMIIYRPARRAESASARSAWLLSASAYAGWQAEQGFAAAGAGSSTARDPRWPGYDQGTSGPAPPLEVITPGGAPPGRLANIRSIPLTGITGRSGLVCWMS